MLTGKIKEDHHFNEGDHRAGLPFYQKENLIKVNQFLSNIEHIAKAKNASLGQLVLKWTVEQPGITVALAGARNAEQAVQNARSADINLSLAEIDYINAEVAKLDLK